MVCSKFNYLNQEPICFERKNRGSRGRSKWGPEGSPNEGSEEGPNRGSERVQIGSRTRSSKGSRLGVQVLYRPVCYQ